jgi:hypothetical protein
VITSMGGAILLLKLCCQKTETCMFARLVPRGALVAYMAVVLFGHWNAH